MLCERVENWVACPGPGVPPGGVCGACVLMRALLLFLWRSKIYILTQFNSTSLNRHLARTYK